MRRGDTVTDRGHLSIGEVLSLLRPEFADITISKIRFLESQGLIDPERTPSGYRKFYEADIDRLRWILVQQRDHFLPLKIIKDRLAEGIEPIPPEPPDEPSPPPAAATAAPDGPAPGAAPSDPPGSTTIGSPDASAPLTPAAGDEGAADPAPDQRAESLPAGPSTPPSRLPPDAGAPRAADPVGGEHAEQAAIRGGAGRDGTDRTAAATSPAATASAALGSGALFSAAELSSATGITAAQLADLERYGLVETITANGGQFYDDRAVVLAKVAVRYGSFGIEARHLRMFKVALDRELALYAQVVSPIAHARAPAGVARAGAVVAELCELGRAMREALLAACDDTDRGLR